MRGSNELHLNEATLIEALQEYFDRRYVATANAPKIVSVDGGRNDFVVRTEEKAKPSA